MLRSRSTSRRGGVLALATVLASAPGLLASVPAGEQPADPQSAYARLALSFEANAGQTDEKVDFLARGAGFTLFLTREGAVLSLRSAQDSSAAVRLRLVGARPFGPPSGSEPQASRSHYFVGNDPARWRRDVPHFARVVYPQVYPGIDLAWYGRQGRLEFDLVVQPGADPGRAQLALEGAERLELGVAGDLLVYVAGVVLRQHAPLAYQDWHGTRQEVPARYRLEGGQVAFELGEYDRSRALVIDPVLSYSTFLGGSGPDVGRAVAVDGAGRAYVSGSTSSADFPTTVGAVQTALAVAPDVFVSKLNSTGSALIYSTFLGGSDSDDAFDLAVDAAGNAYVTGMTSSTDFPTVAALQGSRSGPADAFVSKLDAAGSALVFSTYLGGTNYESGQGIAVDGAGAAYLVGWTNSTDFPTASPLQGTSGGIVDTWVSKVNATGSALTWSTYLGGSGFDEGRGIAVDAGGKVYVTGNTTSANFPTTGGVVQGSLGGGNDAFVTKIDAAGSALVFSTYLGGTDDEVEPRVAVDGAGSAYVAGSTASANFPVTTGAFQTVYAGGVQDVFVSKLNAAGTELAYSTYLGGSGWDQGRGVAVDAFGRAVVAGYTNSADFPTARAVQASNAGVDDVFVAELEASGSALAHASYLGGGGIDEGRDVAVDRAGGIYVAGTTRSADFPTVNPLQAVHGGGTADVLVAKLSGTVKGDFDRDGYADLVFRSNVSPQQNKLWIMNGVVRAAEAPVVPDAASADWKVRGVDDFDLDGNSDLVFWNQATGSVEFWFMSGATRVGPPVPLSGGPVLATNWDLAATADFDHDLRPDIVWRNVTSQKIVIWTMNGASRVGAITPTPDQAVDGNWQIVAALDYDNDGNTDFLWYNWSSGKIVTWYMDASVVRTAGQFTSPANAGDANWRVLASADFSGANVPATPPLRSPDVVWRNETSGNQVVWHMDFASARTTGEFTNPAANTLALGWTIVGPR